MLQNQWSLSATTEQHTIDSVRSSEKFVDSHTTIAKTDLDTTILQGMNRNEVGTKLYTSTQHFEIEECVGTDNCSTEKCLLYANNVEECIPEGRRIVDISYMFTEIQRTFDEHARGIECQFRDWKLVNSRRRGFLTQLFFKCQMCNYETNIWSEPTTSKALDINAAAVAGTITTGIGYFQLEELFAAMNIPCMSNTTYIKNRDKIVEDFHQTAMENMKMAGEAEKQLALERNETINGIPYINVIADGSWMKRSYGNAYDSLSGVGAILGFRTKKVLFIGIRNKFCTICDLAERQGLEPRAHTCYKNFDRNASSTRMESDAIVEGFKNSLEMHGLIFRTVVGDGDSNVYHAIIDNNPYREHMVTVKKVECKNHLLRNLCKKLKVVAETTQPKAQRKRGFVQLRNIVKNNISTIRKEVVEAVALRRADGQPQHRNAMELQKDILNIPSHVFGEHRRCIERGRACTNACDETNKNYVPFLKLHGLYQKVEDAVTYLSAHADSLLLNLTNNPAETFNSIICKEIGGKRINFGKRGSYNARIAGAVVQYNTQQVLTELHRCIRKNVPTVVETLEKRRQKKVAKTRLYQQTNGTKRSLEKQSGTDGFYGAQSQKPDLPEDVVKQLREHHWNKLFENAENWERIECSTRDQAYCEMWQLLRREMLTASNFGTVCRMRPTTSCAGTVKNILYPPVVENAAMKYGHEKEKVAREELSRKLGKEIRACGLFIDRENPCLGASPDGLIDDDGLVEIKCPLSAEHVTAEEAIESLPSLKGIFDKKIPDAMNRNHRFFYQVQGQLNITQRRFCIFAVWTPKSMKVVRVEKDIDFWKNRMLPFLTRFYNACLLPEILDSRHTRHLPIRNPDYILEAQACASKKYKRNDIEKKDVQKECTRMQAIHKSSVATLQTEPDDDVIMLSYCSQITDLTEADMARRKQILDHSIASIAAVKENVLPENSKLNDESLDRFLRVVRDNSNFETQSVLYLEYPDNIMPTRNKSVQIIGGNCTDHWRCIFFDGAKLWVYDSLPGCTYDKLATKEKEYIRRRYPQVTEDDIMFPKVQTQPDYTCCGIYAAAFATTVALGGNPSAQAYSNNAVLMRQHFVNIIENEQLSPFPVH